MRLNRAQAPGSGTGGPDPSQSHASPTELQVSAEGGRLGAQHAPAWLRWGNRRGPAHSPSPPARAPGGEPATANRPAGHSKGRRGPSLTSRMGEAGLTSTGQAAGNPARKVGGGAQVCACACTCMSVHVRMRVYAHARACVRAHAPPHRPLAAHLSYHPVLVFPNCSPHLRAPLTLPALCLPSSSSETTQFQTQFRTQPITPGPVTSDWGRHLSKPQLPICEMGHIAPRSQSGGGKEISRWHAQAPGVHTPFPSTFQPPNSSLLLSP